MYLYSDITGTYVFNQNFQIREKIIFDDKLTIANYKNLQEGKVLETEMSFLERFKNIKDMRKEHDPETMERVYSALMPYREELYRKNSLITRAQIRESVTEDQLIIQASHAIDELGKSSNMIVKRLREWFIYSLPEVEEKVDDHERFVSLLLEKGRKELISDFRVKDSMGISLSKEDEEAFLSLARSIRSSYDRKAELERYLEKKMKKICPNITAVAGAQIGAQLLAHAGSLRKMVMMPSSTIQLLGAEKALFRHLVNNKARPPKHGLILQHEILQKAPKQDRGKVARALADKIGLAAKIDYFKGEFIGDKLRKQLEEKFR